MQKKIALFLLILLAFVFQARACRYTVREIGYADFGVTPYKLIFFYDNETPDKQVKTFRRVTYAALYDANVVVEMVNVAQDTNSIGLDYLTIHPTAEFPTTILVSPEGRAMPFDFSGQESNFKTSVWELIESIVSSPLREQILPRLAKTYGAALIVEGSDAAQNREVREKVQKALEEIKKMMGQMPKMVETPPELHTLSFENQNAERVLLWSLGIQTGQTIPQVAILYGRGRRMGPVLSGKHVTENNLLNLLGLIGADCECGLDRSWLLGTMIPLRWSPELRKLLVKQLGFDVENPAVKSEMSQIIAISQAGGNRQSNDRLYSYREEVIQVEPEIETPRVSFSALQSMNADGEAGTGVSPFKIAWAIVGGIFLLVLVTGSVFLIRAKRRSN